MVEIDAKSFGSGLLSAIVTVAAYAVTLGRKVATKEDLESNRSELRREMSQLLAADRAVLDEKVRQIELKIEAADRHAKSNRDIPMAALIEAIADNTTAIGGLVRELQEDRRGG